jgi:hypothetical protein
MNLLRAAVRLAGDERVNDPSSKLGGAVIYVEGKRHVIPTIEELQAKMPGLGDDEAKNRQRSEYDRLSSQADTDTPMLDRPDPERDKVKTPLNHRMRWDAYVDDGTIEEAARRLQSPPLQSLLARLQPKDFKIPAREQFLDGRDDVPLALDVDHRAAELARRVVDPLVARQSNRRSEKVHFLRLLLRYTKLLAAAFSRSGIAT